LKTQRLCNQKIPGDFTQGFFSSSGDDRGNATAELTGVPSWRGPREPTNRFSAAGTGDCEPTVADFAPGAPSGIPRKLVLRSTDSIKSTGPDNSSGAASPPQPKPVPSSASGKTDDLSTVTCFFPGPFDGQRSAETSDLSQAVAKGEKKVGDLTSPLGAPKVDSSTHLAGSAGAKHPAAASDPGSFTKLFESIALLKKTSSDYKADTATEDRTDASSGLPLAARGRPSPGSGSAKTPMDSSAPPTSSQPVSSLSALPTGPSEYTRIVSGGLKPGASGELPDRAGPHVSGGTGVPPLAATSPQFSPVAGQLQVPAPALVLPAAQGPPLAPGAQKAAGPPWTMILILNGLFILAVLMVLYFVFRR
jgi:hypothetical protein